MGSRSVTERNHVTWHKDALEAMENAGFPKDRAEHALVASGHRDVATAIKWLHHHKDDPNVNESLSRQYVLFLTPKGTFADQLKHFWESSASQCGKNAVHDLFPHITLTRFFQVENFRVPALLEMLDQTWQKLRSKKPRHVRLFLHKTRGYMALFLEESTSEWLSEVMKTFGDKALGTLGLSVPVHGGQFHLTLAYQFEESAQRSLEKLARNINLESSNEWELQLYSRDARTALCKQVRSVIHQYGSESQDELSIVPGHHILLDKELPIHKGWLKGTCYETGNTGIFPGNYTEKSVEWKCWTKHWVIPIHEMMVNDKTNRRTAAVHEQVHLRKSTKQKPDEGRKMAPGAVETTEIHRSGSLSTHRSRTDPDISRNNTLPRSRINSSVHDSRSAARKRRFFIIRHGERVDITFGQSWIGQFFDERGGYHRRNLNMPKRLPLRNGGPTYFAQDSPITEIGACQALLTGESLFAHNISISKVLTSPAFRCVQTAETVMEGLKIKGKVKIDIEPALYEWLAWCKGKLPRWLSHEELLTFGVNINTKYSQFMNTKDFNMNESVEQFYNRTYNAMKSIVDQLGPEDVNILIVGHAASLDACTKQLTGGNPLQMNDFVKMNQKIPYCGMSVIEESSRGGWRLVQPPIPSLIHGSNNKFDWRLLQDQEIKKPYAV